MNALLPAFLGALPVPTLRPVHPFCGRALSARRLSVTSPCTPSAVLETQSATEFGKTADEAAYTVTVLEGNRVTQIQVDRDTNLRTALKDNKIDVYTLKGKLLNCGGYGQCGTCIIAVEDGLNNTNERGPREEKQLKGKPENWRLACRSLIDGDVTIRTKPQE